MLALQLVTELILYVGIGIFLEKRRMVSDDFDRQLSVLFTDIILPCMIFQSLQLAFDPQDLKNCAVLLVLSVGFLAVSLLLGQLAFHVLKKGDWGRIVRFNMVFTNFTLMGFPIVETLFGAHALFYFMIFLVPIRVVFYSGSHHLLAPPEMEIKKTTTGQKIRSLFSPPMLGVLVGLVFYVFQWSLPAVLGDVVSGLAATASPVGMMLCGLVLGKRPLRRLLRVKYALVGAFRLLALPALFYLLVLPLPITQEMRQVVVACAALPCASLSASFTLRYNRHQDAQFDAAGTVLVSHLLSIATIPLWAAVLA